MATLGERLRKARSRKGLTQKVVQEKTGITDKSLSRYENNASEPDVESLNKLASLYEVTTDWILSGKNKTESEYTLPESEYDRVIREAEKHYGVNLRDNLVVNATLRELILGIAKSLSDKK